MKLSQLHKAPRPGSRVVLPALMLMAAAASPVGALPASGTALLSTAATPAGAVVISEMRPSGPNGAGDSFIELFNAGAKPLSLAGWSLRFEAENGAPVSVKLGAGSRIGARAHWLLVGSNYSLQNLAKGDGRFEAGMFGGVALLDAKGTTIDAVGAANAPARAREGAGLPVLAFTRAQAREVPQYAYVRRALDGQPQDTDDNARDFALVSVTGTLFGEKTPIGVPGPENASSPRLRPAAVMMVAKAPDATTPDAAPLALPSAVPVALQLDPERNSMRRARRDTGPLKTFGTMTLRYRLTNDGEQPIKNLWFRVASITCDPEAAGLEAAGLEAAGLEAAGPEAAGPEAAPPGNAAPADIRLIRGKAAPATAPTTASTTGTQNQSTAAEIPAQRTLSVWKAKLVAVPSQPLGGGLNALLQVELPAGGIAPGARGEVTFSFGVERRGNYRVVLGNQSMHLVFEGNTEDDLDQPSGIAASGPAMARGMRSSVSMSRGASGGPQGAGGPGTAGAAPGTPPTNGLPDEIAEGIIIEGNTEDGVIVPPIKPSGNPA